MSKIEWTNKTWNPTTGCNKISQGCKNCYAEKMHKRLAGMGQVKYSQPFASGVVTHEGELDRPGEWKTPAMVFVDSMSDLFHTDVPFEFIAMVFNHMAYYNWHTYQVLTKRADRMLEFYQWFTSGESVIGSTLMSRQHHWPLPNVWIGVSVENDDHKDRIEKLRQVPAAVRFLSLEPLIGPINNLDLKGIHWVIAGGESGHKARPMHPDWVRSIRDKCKESDVAFFFKQWGAYIPYEPHWQAPYFTSANSGASFDGHGMNFIDPETGEGGKWAGKRWYDPMDSIQLCLETNSRPCSFLKRDEKHASLDGFEYRAFPISSTNPF